VIDLFDYWPVAVLAGIPAKALIDKALARAPGGYQQSYPHKTWMSSKFHTDQTFRSYFTSSLEHFAATRGVQ
jgi:hypothetical protein